MYTYTHRMSHNAAANIPIRTRAAAGRLAPVYRREWCTESCLDYTLGSGTKPRGETNHFIETRQAVSGWANLAMMAWMWRTVWCMLSCALTRLPSWRRICRVVAGCAASTSGTSAASGAAVASITAPAATADDLCIGKNGRKGDGNGRAVSSNARGKTTKKNSADGSVTDTAAGRKIVPHGQHPPPKNNARSPELRNNHAKARQSA